jgi:hypothetical protein
MVSSMENEVTRTGYLHLNGWGGVTSRKVEVIGETSKRLRIRAITETKLAGRCRWLKPGETALVPKYAVTDGPLKGEGKL